MKLLLGIVFLYQKLSETLRMPSHESLLGDKKISTTFCKTQIYGSPERLHLTIGKKKNYHEHQRPPETQKRPPYFFSVQ